MITSCNHSENIICGSCLMKNHREKQVTENLLRGELLKRSLRSVVARAAVFGNARCA